MLSKVFFVFALTFISSTLSLAVPIPQRCDAVSTTSTVTDIATNLTVLTLGFELHVHDDYKVTVENFYSQAVDSSYSSSPFQAIVDGTLKSCMTNGSGICYFQTLNSTFQLQSNLSLKQDSEIQTLFNGVVDELSFSSVLGPFFAGNQTCGVDRTFLTNYNIYTKTCCTSEKATYAAVQAPTCKAYQSRSTIYNTDDNYSVYATAKLNYTVAQNSISVNGTATGPDNTWVSVLYNGFWPCGRPIADPLTCSFQTYGGDSKYLFSVSLIPQNATSDPLAFYYQGVAGRLIVRDGLTLSEEGMNFTPKNDCSYFSSMVDTTKVFTSQFCCTAFNNQ